MNENSNTGGRKTSGLEKVPPIFKRPIYTDRTFWWGVASAIFWITILWWLFS